MNGFLLPNDVLVEAFLHVKKFFRFRFHHLADRYARPLGNHLGNIIDIHHFVQLVIRFPTVTFFTEITFQAQTFRFLAGSPFIIPFHACLLFLGTQAVQFHFLLLQFRRHGVEGNPQLGGCLVHQVNCLIRQSAVRDILCGKPRRRHQGFIREVNLVMRLIAVTQTVEHFDRILHGRFLNKNRGKTTLQRGVLFNIFLVLIQGGCANTL